MRYHLGINLGHDRSAAIVADGEIVCAIQQERLDKQKYSVGFLAQGPDASRIQLPLEAISYCLDTLGIGYGALASITANMPGIDHSASILRRALPREAHGKIVTMPSHHLAHAYSAYWPSGFDEAIILIADGAGSARHNRTESYSVYEARDKHMHLLHGETVPSHWAAFMTLGFIYESITKLAGFSTDVSDMITLPEAGKLMGLAAYGGPQAAWRRWITPVKGSYSLKIAPYDIFLELAAIIKRYDNGDEQRPPYFKPYIVDLAYKVQHEVEQALLHLVGLAQKHVGINKLCLSGGVALNAVANYKLLRELALDDIFIFPAAGDAGIAAGCALYAYVEHEKAKGKAPHRELLRSAFLGRRYTDSEMRMALDARAEELLVIAMSCEQMVSEAAQAMAAGKIVGRFEGGAEYGPRALGNRSIIADALLTRIKDVLNVRVKHREPFRPFAPVVPAELAQEYFDIEHTSPFMLLVAPVRPQFYDVLPAITHYDKTARLQTVSDNNSFLYQLCHALASLHGAPPVIVNTSFNVAGQPIVETPEDAVAAFLSTDIDILCMDRYWITKRRQTDLPYADYVRALPPVDLPAGLPANQPSVDALMRCLHRALVCQEMDNCPWDQAEVRALSAQGGKYLTGSQLFAGMALSLPEQFIFLINPWGKTPVLSRWGEQVAALSFDELRIVSALTEANLDKLDQMRKQLGCAPRVWHATLARLKAFGHAGRQDAAHAPNQEAVSDSEWPYAVNKTLEPFGDPDFQLCDGLESFYRLLKAHDYTESTICKLLRVECLQKIEVHQLAYYDRFTLAEGPLEDLIRLFLLRKKMPQHRARKLFGHVYGLLTAIGLLMEQGDTVSSWVDIYCAEELYIATDHRYMVYPDDHVDQEQPVMYIGLDSHGLKNVMPRQPVARALDLCTGSGVQALTASLFASHVIAIDINPRALRFARFNAQLNGIGNVEFRQGDVCHLSASLDEFDLILANPPFVPAPTQSLRYRDGGARGEDILRCIVEEAESHLREDGILCIVSDLINVNDYRATLQQWWRGAAKCMVLMTADRNDIQFCLPHCQRPFDQSYREFCDELTAWVSHFRAAALQAVNFGFILLQKKNSGDFAYFSKVIHTPTSPIYTEIWPHFDRLGDLMSVPASAVLRLHPAVKLRSDISSGGDRRYAVTSEHQYFSEYEVPARVYRLLYRMLKEDLTLSSIAEQDREIVNVLYEKGIITIANLCGNVLNMARDRGKSARIKKVSIREHATNTTPTCLSSYLKQ